MIKVRISYCTDPSPEDQAIFGTKPTFPDEIRVSSIKDVVKLDEYLSLTRIIDTIRHQEPIDGCFRVDITRYGCNPSYAWITFPGCKTQLDAMAYIAGGK